MKPFQLQLAFLTITSVLTSACAAFLTESPSNHATIPAATTTTTSSSLTFVGPTKLNSPSHKNTQLSMSKSSSSSPEESSSSTSSSAKPNLREEYTKWRLQYKKGDFDPVRYEHFKSNFLKVTKRNAMEQARAQAKGASKPTPIKLNEYGDLSAAEYKEVMSNNKKEKKETKTKKPAKPAASKKQPAAVIETPLELDDNTKTNIPKTPSEHASAAEELENATNQYRAAIRERIGLEKELETMKDKLKEKMELLKTTEQEEKQRSVLLSLRQEQKKALRDKLDNGWGDE